MKKIHEIMGHLGTPSVLDCLKSRWYWPTLAGDYQQYCKACHECQVNETRTKTLHQPMHPLPPSGVPFHRWGIDFIQDLQKSQKGNTQIITFIDYATRYVVAKAVPNRSSKTVATFIYEIMIKFGAPYEIISDRASCFTSELMQEYLHLQEINHYPSTPYHPNTNGCVERMHGVLWPMILKMTRGCVEKWDHYLDAAVFAINARTHTVTGYSPFFLVYGMQPRMPGDLKPLFTFDLSNEDDRFSFAQRELIELGHARAAALLKSQKQADQMKKNQAKRQNLQPHSFEIGEFVKVKDNAKTKLDDVFKGPFIISEKGPHDVYYLKTPGGLEIKNPLNHCYLEPYLTQQQYSKASGLLPSQPSPEGEDTVIVQ